MSQSQSQWNSDSSLRSVDPFAVDVYSYTAAAAAAMHMSTDGSHHQSGSNKAASASLPSPPPSPLHNPVGYDDANEEDVRIPGLHLGPRSSYNHNVERAMKAPPQSILALPNHPTPSWSDINGLSTTPLSISSSSSSSSSSSTSSSQSQSPAPYSHPGHATERSIQPAPFHVFNDLRAEVERYRHESDDLPVLKKKRDRVYAGF